MAIQIDLKLKMFTYEHNFCHNCGAKMEVTE